MLHNNTHIEIIAEVGVNHGGSLDIAKDLVCGAKKAGADVVKFQIYDPSKRAGIDHHPYKDVLIKSRVTKRFLYEVKEYADRADIEFMASVFDVDKVAWTEEVGMKRYKIASKSIYDKELCKAIFNTGKPAIISYGMAQDNRAPYLMKLLERDEVENPDVKRLYCVSNYPTMLDEVEFFSLVGKEMWNIFNFYDGFSDHTIGLSASKVAMSLGATIIEKHVTLDKSMNGPDHVCSATLEELKELCLFRDDTVKLLYKGGKE